MTDDGKFYEIRNLKKQNCNKKAISIQRKIIFICSFLKEVIFPSISVDICALFNEVQG